MKKDIIKDFERGQAISARIETALKEISADVKELEILVARAGAYVLELDGSVETTSNPAK